MPSTFFAMGSAGTFFAMGSAESSTVIKGSLTSPPPSPPKAGARKNNKAEADIKIENNRFMRPSFQ